MKYIYILLLLISSSAIAQNKYTIRVSNAGAVDSIRLVNTGVLHTTPAAFSKVGTTGVITQTLATQTAGSIFSNSTASTAQPTFTTSPRIATDLQVGSTATIPASAILNIESTTKGVLLPRMTTTQIGSISSPESGLIAINTDSSNAPVYYNGTSWGEVGGLPEDHNIDKYNLLGWPVKAVTFPIEQINSGLASLADAGLNSNSVQVIRPTTVSRIWWFQSVQGVYTGDAYNGIGLYSYSGGTLTLLASTTNDSEIWKGTANSWQSKALSASVTLTPGVYFIAALYNQSAQTTAPVLGSMSSTTNAAVHGPAMFTNSARTRFVLATQASMPSTIAMSGVASNATNPFFGLE